LERYRVFGRDRNRPEASKEILAGPGPHGKISPSKLVAKNIVRIPNHHLRDDFAEKIEEKPLTKAFYPAHNCVHGVLET